MKKMIFGLLFASAISYADTSMPFDPNLRGIIMVSNSNKKLFIENKQGYINSDQERYVRFLLNIKNNALSEIKAFRANSDVYDTHLKRNYSEIKLSIPFKKINAIQDKNIIGYAAIGSYENGWTGIKMFFNDEQLGSCAYSKDKILAIKMEKENTDYIVNSKPSFKVITGNYESGFINNVSWYTDHKDYVIYEQVDCANKKLDKNILNKMVVLSNQIDKSN